MPFYHRVRLPLLIVCLSAFSLSGCATHFLMSSDRYKTPAPKQDEQPATNPSKPYQQYLQNNAAIPLFNHEMMTVVQQRYHQRVAIR